jgi:hypothetical protein
MMFPISFKSYNVQGQRAAFDAFNALTADAIFINSTILFERYSTQAVQAVPSEKTAFPHRADNLLMYVLIFPPLPSSCVRPNDPLERPSSATL